jgi:predicted GNAT family acetyltransferase
VTTDKTGALTTVTKHARHFTIAADDASAGMATFIEHEGRRIFLHTEVKAQFEGRGLATILVTEALTATRDDGLRIVAVCPMVAAYVTKHHEFDDIVDPVTPQIQDWLVAQGHN